MFHNLDNYDKPLKKFLLLSLIIMFVMIDIQHILLKLLQWLILNILIVKTSEFLDGFINDEE